MAKAEQSMQFPYSSTKNYNFQGNVLSVEIYISKHGALRETFIPLPNIDEARALATKLIDFDVKDRGGAKYPGPFVSHGKEKFGIYLTPFDLVKLIYKTNAPFKAVNNVDTPEEDLAREYIISVAKKVYIDNNAENKALSGGEYGNFKAGESCVNNHQKGAPSPFINIDDITINRFIGVYEKYAQEAARDFEEMLNPPLAPTTHNDLAEQETGAATAPAPLEYKTLGSYAAAAGEDLE